MFDHFRKPPLKGGITASAFECKRDILSIPGTEYRPESEALPIAIVCHGFMAWQNTVRHYAIMLAEMGFAAYCFDFCGGSVMKKGKSEGATTDMSVLTEVKDLEAVINYVQSPPYNSKDRVTSMDGHPVFLSCVSTTHYALIDSQ